MPTITHRAARPDRALRLSGGRRRTRRGRTLPHECRSQLQRSGPATQDGRTACAEAPRLGGRPPSGGSRASTTTWCSMSHAKMACPSCASSMQRAIAGVCRPARTDHREQRQHAPSSPVASSEPQSNSADSNLNRTEFGRAIFRAALPSEGRPKEEGAGGFAAGTCAHLHARVAGTATRQRAVPATPAYFGSL